MPRPERIPPVPRVSPTNDLPLFTAAEARDAAIERAEVNADPQWKERAIEAIRQVAERNRTFIVDDVWDTGLSKPREGRAMGAMLRRAEGMGLIRNTHQYRASEQVNCHKNPRSVWASLIYEARDAA